MKDKQAQEKIGKALQRKFNWDRAIYLRHPERDEYFEEMAGEALYQAEKLGYRKLPKDKPPLLSEGEMQNIRFNNSSPNAPRLPSYVSVIAHAQREADIRHYEMCGE